MLLSPPFVLPPLASETENQWLDRLMDVGAPGEGSFPVSFEMNWHGGVHLTAPATGRTRAPVRAISDGSVAFVRKPTPRSTDPKHALNYRGGWTDDGCVIIRHETDIGAAPGAAGTRTTVVFFSVYMHLGGVSALSAGDAIFRKDIVGTAGSIYGVDHKFHLEIVCDDANVKALTGRTATFTPVDTDGRKDAIFGAIWFFCLLNTPFFQSEPRAGKPLPPVVFTNSDTALFFRMAFTGRDATFTAHHLGGSAFGAPLVAANFGTQLVNRATARFPRSPSAGVELMRFGRVIGPDPLLPANAPNWCEVPLATGTGWVDMNGSSVRRFSDADFPSWDSDFKHGWVLVDAASSPDSRCLDLNVIDLLDIDRDLAVSPQEAQTRLNDPATQAGLARKICKFPTEWDAQTIDARFGWIKTDKRLKTKPAEYAAFKAHVTALCFWQTAKPIDGVHWHLHPREFIRHLRKCVWLSNEELAQSIPRKQLELSGTTFRTITIAQHSTALQRATQWNLGINRSVRKYLIALTTQRLAHFFAQVFTESGSLRFVSEIGGSSASYAPYYGRGLIQLTHLSGYQKYGIYRGFPASSPTTNPTFSALGWDPDALIAASNTVFDAENCVDTASFFWTQSPGSNGNTRADGGVGVSDATTVSHFVNGGHTAEQINGLDARLETLIYLKYVLMDDVRPGPTESVTFTWRRNSSKEPVFLSPGVPSIDPSTGLQRKKFFPIAHTIDVPLDLQK
jgi:hydroxyethylthiazole kinase